MTEDDLKNEIWTLKKTLKEKEQQIEYLKKIALAYGKAEEMTTKELLEAEERVKTHARLSDFSEKELKLRDIVLNSLLKINKSISSLQDEEILLKEVLTGLITALKAERGILFFVKKNKTIPAIFHNIHMSELKKQYFQFCQTYIDEVVRYRKSVYRLFEELDFDGEEHSISFVCLPLLYEDRLMGVIYVDIISDVKTFRVQDMDVAELFSSQAAISMNNAELYRKIREQNLELLKLINIKDQLIREVSKKIRDPMTQISKLIKTITDSLKSEGGNDLEDLDKIMSLVEKVEATVDKVVTIQELEREVDDLFSETVNFNELFDFILAFYRHEIEKRNLKIQVELSPHFECYHANRAILRTIFEELLSNAIFYNKHNGSINIRGNKKGDYLVIEIEDTGVGIKKEDLGKVFDQFFRTENSLSYNEKGAGLGLYLVQKFINYYKGSITADSTYGVGSKFTVKLLQN